jgi:hypothetical protein
MSWTQAGSDSLAAPGFELFKAGQNNNCAGEEYSMTRGWNRVVFLRYGSGVDYRAKLSFQAVDDTVYQGPPSFTTYQILRSLRLDYVLNSNSTDLSGPVSIRTARPDRGPSRFGARVEHELYNPLGIKLRHEPGRFEPTLKVIPSSGGSSR